MISPPLNTKKALYGYMPSGSLIIPVHADTGAIDACKRSNRGIVGTFRAYQDEAYKDYVFYGFPRHVIQGYVGFVCKKSDVRVLEY